MENNAHISQDFVKSVVAGSALADVSLLAFRDPDHYIAGELHRHQDNWNAILKGCDSERFEEVRDWIVNYVDPRRFFTRFEGSYKGVNYSCDSPPARVFSNHPSCKAFVQYISDTILARLRSGAISLWGQVGECAPPHLVMPLTVEPSKPRLCNDNRFLNLWTQDRPFSLDSILNLPKYVSKDSYQTVCDDKSGYDHIQLCPDSRTYFGFEWGGWFFVSCCLPFGWKSSAYIYHTTGLVASHYLRSQNIPSSLYIDDRHTGQLSFAHGSLPRPYKNLASVENVHLALANAAAFVTCHTLTSLGYFIGLEKSTLSPSQQVRYLGFVCDSVRQAFTLLPHKKAKFVALIKEALDSRALDLTTLQKLGGKCVSMSLAVPGARLYCNEINLAISRAMRSARPVRVSTCLRKELEHWLFLDHWNGFLPWRSERHCHIKLYSDSSSYAWGGVLSPGAVEVNIYDYWNSGTISSDIATKEVMALHNVLLGFADAVKDSWVDAFVDSQTLIRSWKRQGSRSPSLIGALKKLFEVTVQLNVDLHLYYVASAANLADAPSRHLSLQDSMLSPALWQLVQSTYGGVEGHSVDLMARPSNVQTSLTGDRLPFFSESLLPDAAGVNVFAQQPSPSDGGLFRNPYVFPPICLIPHVFKFLTNLGLAGFTIVVPDVCPRRFWWPLLVSSCSSTCLLAGKGSTEALLTPSKEGFASGWPIPWDLWAFRIVNASCPM